jgi:transcriptional regulator with XRE-family HTH domain
MAANLTGSACRAARALLKWSTRALAQIAGVSPATVNQLEADRPYRDGTAAKIIAAFARSGVEITNGAGTGARMRSFWRIDQPKTTYISWTAHQHPFTGRIAPIGEFREQMVHWCEGQGLVQSETDADVWFEEIHLR